MSVFVRLNKLDKEAFKMTQKEIYSLDRSI